MEGRVWEPNTSLYVSLVICIYVLLGISLSSSSFSSSVNGSSGRDVVTIGRSKSPSSPFGISSVVSLHFQRKFLLVYSLASIMEGMWAVFGEHEYTYFGLEKEEIFASICLGLSVSLIVGPFLGVLSDYVGHKKVCLLFSVVHLAVGVWNRTTMYPNLWFGSVCLQLCTSMFSCSFEAWLVVENEEQNYRRDTLCETFWLMTFLESVMLIGSQVLANKMCGSVRGRNITLYSSVSIVLSMIFFIYLSKGGKKFQWTTCTRISRVSYTKIVRDKRLWLLGFAHACLNFSIAVFWILWAPTLVADGREVNLGLIYPCLMGARMLGCTLFQLLSSSQSSPRTEDSLMYAFLAMGLVLSVVAYDYQEIGVLVFLFLLFHVGVGFIIPSLARLRAIHVPNEIRGGLMSFSLSPVKAVLLFLLIQRGYYQNIENSTMIAVAAAALFVASGCMYSLKRGGKLRYQNGHKL